MAPAETSGTAQLTTSRTAPPGYKLIKVRKPDGTIVTVKKKLSPEELEKQQQSAQPEALAPAPKTDATSPSVNAKKDAVQYKIITVRMPDGTLAKVKRPIDKTSANNPTEKPAGNAAATTTADKSDASDASKNKDSKPAEAPAPEQPLAAVEKEALREQAHQNKQQRRSRFKHALLFGLVGASGIVLPDLLDGDEIVSDTDISDDEDYDDKHLDDDHDGPDDVHDEKNTGADSRVDPAIVTGAATVAAGVAAAAITTAPPQQPPPAARRLPGNQPDGDDAKDRAANGKSAYKVTVKDLKDLDEGAEKKEESQRGLERRWAAFSFYFMASLSIILPALFLALACFIMVMNGKSVDSSWGKMIDPIKIAITVWPIVFAAVAAQGFKTWAAYKVERGVKLMELEQLVGSNSFGAVMKQPFLLRRLDLLTMGIFLIWALSPLGSQALIRSYSLDRAMINDTVPVKYAPVRGYNRLLSPGAEGNLDETTISDLWQAVAVYYVGGTFMQSGVKRDSDPKSQMQDHFNHPLPRFYHDGRSPNEFASLYGVPIALLSPVVEFTDGQEAGKDKDKHKASTTAQIPFEEVTFPIISSYFNLTCGDWTKMSRGELNDEDMTAFSLSQTLGVAMFPIPGNTSFGAPVDRLRFATLLDSSKLLNNTGLELGENIKTDRNWVYETTECKLQQIFFSGTVFCRVDATSSSVSNHDCQVLENVQRVADQDIDPAWYTPLADFSGALVYAGSPYPLHYPQTPIELYALSSGNKIDGASSGNPPYLDPIINGQTPDYFAYYFSTLLNTFIHIAHCPECITTTMLGSVNMDLADSHTPSGVAGGASLPESVKPLYKSPETNDGFAKRGYSPTSLVFKLDWRWVAVFLTSVIILLIVGIVSVVLEGMLIAPDVLGYASTLARNSRYLHLPKTAAKPMSGPERARAIGGVKVMIQDVKPDKEVGKIALGLKHDRAEPLKTGRLYR
ncbi:hypothetical protein B0T18DRAFT_448539 [Schizothecium vesticola]|uniref:Uncharacterized protein n=1 Tax=Schizothecium vesticola TaxID=314040 RepID=A0AA40ER55_9PEZI|nr:hypothetical protein B0T18DRAFT_448539 [Schizothecium vesticola]